MAWSVSPDTADGWRSLAGVPLLSQVGDDRLRALWDASAARRYPAGEALRNVGDPATHLLLLLRGRVAATATTRSGRVVRFGAWDGPRALDKVAVIDGRGHTATLTALTPCTVRSLPRDRFLALVDDAPSVRGHVLRVLAAHARHRQQQFATTATLPAEARLASWLLDQAAGRPGPVALPGTQQVVADLLGVTRVTINRVLSRLRRDGLIEIEHGTVSILAPELLALRAEGRGRSTAAAGKGG
ncbi:Crp/Fnr family transcriptional regulator [Sphaerisporangium dianthi]|uniref:Crp/Fnr family transcriptional regulator n=1 Tax=Sphaerisporangium dianthi TaxID=1436120 RepID=A0ABV9CMI4_9ACTN